MFKFKNPFARKHSPSQELQAFRGRRIYWQSQGLTHVQAAETAHQELYGIAAGRYPLGGLKFGWYPIETR